MDSFGNIIEAVSLWIGHGLCHQIGERSLFINGIQFSVCYRDMGIHLGVLFGLLVLFLIDNKKSSSFSPLKSFPLLLISGALMTLEATTAMFGLREGTNVLRMFTGIPVGYGIALILYPLWNDVNYGENEFFVLDVFKKWILFLSSMILVAIFALYILPNLGMFGILIGILSTIAIFTILITILLKTISRFSEFKMGIVIWFAVVISISVLSILAVFRDYMFNLLT